MSSAEDIRSDLRERYLRFLATMVGKEATINMYEQVKVSGRLLGSQSSSDCLLFSNLQTPIGTLPAAALRMKDVERKELLCVIEQFSWIADITMMDYFVDDVWQKLPSSWREFLKDTQPNDWSHLLSYDIAPLNRVLPLSFLCLLRFSRSHSLDRTPPQDPGQMIQHFPSTSIALELSDSFTSTPKSLQSRIKLKKQHEIDRILELIRVILQIAESRGNRIERIVDVGAGIGHLSRMIAVHFPHLRIEAIEGESTFDEKARYLDDNMKRRVELNQPIRSVQFLKCDGNDAETIGSEESGSKTLLIGLHSCGDLSPTSIRNFLSSPSASALLLFGCCYHKLSPYKYGQNDQTTIHSDDPQNQKIFFGFPLSKAFSSVQFSYAARELACHSIESFAKDLEKNDLSGPISRAYRAALEQIIQHAHPGSEKQMKTTPVNKPFRLTFEEYANKALDHEQQLLDEIRNHLPCATCSPMTARLHEHATGMMSVHCLRLLVAPLIESEIKMVQVEDIDVKFPYEPYECQMKMMREVIRGLNNKWDVVIESPTGTGKTIALLCSALAWQESNSLQIKKELQLQKITGNQPSQDSVMPGMKTVPQIFYCSRTHSQLKQVAKQFNSSSYKTRATTSILASRDNLCNSTSAIRPNNDALLQAFCSSVRKKHTCEEYNNLEGADTDTLKANYKYMEECLDIEELTTIASKHRQCSYYLSRHMSKEANLVLLPYNYLINVGMMQTFDLQLNGAIVIFDEAHNLESQCEEEASTSISTTVIGRAIEEMQQAILLAQTQIEEDRLEADISEQPFQGKDKKEKNTIFNVGEAGGLLDRLFKLEAEIIKTYHKYKKEAGPQTADHVANFMPGSDSECALEGKVMMQILENAQIDIGASGKMTNLFDTIAEYLESKENPSLDGKFIRAVSNFFSIICSTHCAAIAMIMHNQDNSQPAPSRSQSAKKFGTCLDVAKHYKLHINAKKISKEEVGKVKIHGKDDDDLEVIINYMCFTAVPTMRFLKLKGVRSVITASGTLAPLDLFTSNLGLNFGSTLENMHVAKPNQLICGKIGLAPTGKQLMGTASASTPEYYSAIVKCLLEMEKFVPQGMLVFFKSKDAIFKANQAYNMLTSHGTYARKKLFVEPDRAGLVPSMLVGYRKGCATKEGAMLFSVMRGRMSEGIDFADCESRAVVIVSLPYMNLGSERVKLKRLHLEKIKRGDGEKWYAMDAQRTTNQSIGRVLRHANDFGVVALLDQRFVTQANHAFPKWVHPSIKSYGKFEDYTNDLSAFFKQHDCSVALQPRNDTSSVTRARTTIPSKADFFKPKAFASFDMKFSTRENQPPAQQAANEGAQKKLSSLSAVASSAGSNFFSRFAYAKVSSTFGSIPGPSSSAAAAAAATSSSSGKPDVLCVTQAAMPPKKKLKLTANRPMPKEAPEVPVVTLEDSDDDCGWPIKKKK